MGNNFNETMQAVEEAIEGYIELNSKGEWDYQRTKMTLPPAHFDPYWNCRLHPSRHVDMEEDLLICERSVFMASLGEFKPSEITEEEAMSIMDKKNCSKLSV
jgi:hypothetical protein